MYFPLKKTKVNFNHSEKGFLASYKEATEIPILPHPGAFAKVRTHHQHEGVDLYCEEGDEVVSIEDGIVIDIFAFTGEQVGTSWWNNTWAILIEGQSGVFNYGEIIPDPKLKKGDKVNAGEIIGKVTAVLKKDKGRPMAMLHLEQYIKGTSEAVLGWNLKESQPVQLLNPTDCLIKIAHVNKLFK